MQDIRAINEQVTNESLFVDEVLAEIGKVLIGQRNLAERLLVGLLGNGHLLLEGVPGLAKTLSIKTLAQTIDAHFQRIQFTPDLLPSDLIGTLVFNPKTGEFTSRKGPVFTNILLADEINRAPAKVQSALLEAMQERQVTIGEEAFKLPEPFLVLATQNPIEQEGTYPLPEAQIDRFMLKVKISYPSPEEEKEILEKHPEDNLGNLRRVVKPADIQRVRKLVKEIYMDDKIKTYILNLILATRKPAEFKAPELAPLIAFGASPRATLSLAQGARAYAFLKKRGYVTPEDVKAVGADVLRHRVLLTYEAEAEGKTSEDIVKRIFDTVEVP